MDRLFRSVPRYALPSHEGGYERLLALEGESTIIGTMRFGTRRGWLAEDTLSLDTELGKLQTSLGAWTKVQALMDKYKKSKAGPGNSEDEKTKDMGAKKAEERWSSESKARVSGIHPITGVQDGRLVWVLAVSGTSWNQLLG